MEKHDLGYISNAYGVPARKGQRVEYTPSSGEPRTGHIVGARGAYLRIHFDGEPKPFAGVFHPTWNIRYCDSVESQ